MFSALEQVFEQNIGRNETPSIRGKGSKSSQLPSNSLRSEFESYRRSRSRRCADNPKAVAPLR